MSALACLMTSVLAVVVSGGATSVTYFITEELAPGSVVGNVVDDFALGELYSASTLSGRGLRFEFLTEPMGGHLRLENGSWNLVVAGRIDRESLCKDVGRCLLHYTLAVRPLDVFRLLDVQVEVLDVNDHPPRFSGLPRRWHVAENVEVGSRLSVATVLDEDVGVNGLDRYETTTDCVGLDPRPMTRALAGREVELQLRVERPLDRETQNR